MDVFKAGDTSLNPRDLSKGKIKRTPDEEGLRKLGFKSLKEQGQADRGYTLSKIERELENRIATNGKKARELMVSGKPASEYLIKYTELGGDPATVINGLEKAKLDRVSTELERRAREASSGTRQSILKLQRYIEVYGRNR